MDNYVSRQISVYKTGKALLEFNDKLNTAPEESYAHIHAKGEELFGVKQYSLIGMVLQDYSKGTGDKTVRVTANISPEQALFIYSRILVPVKDFYFYSEKIFGNPDKDGYAQMAKITIKRSPNGTDGKPSRYPWGVFIENGKGIPQRSEIGGVYAKKDSYVCTAKAGIYINDEDFFTLFSRVESFIKVFEMTYGCKLIKDGRKMYSDIIAQKNNKSAS